MIVRDLCSSRYIAFPLKENMLQIEILKGPLGPLIARVFLGLGPLELKLCGHFGAPLSQIKWIIRRTAELSRAQEISYIGRRDPLISCIAHKRSPVPIAQEISSVRVYKIVLVSGQ